MSKCNSSFHTWGQNSVPLQIIGFLLVVLVNPFGNTLGSIYTIPKLSIFLWLCFALCKRGQFFLDAKLVVLSSAFLVFSLLSTMLAPNPYLAFWGQHEIGDGWLYWLIFYLFLNLWIGASSQFREKVRFGMRIGMVVVAISAYFCPTVFFSHRGHTAFVIGLLMVEKFRWWLLPPLIFCQCRAVWIALALLRSWKFLLPVLPIVFRLDSGRVKLWALALRRISESPLFGWGFAGFNQRWSDYLHYTYKAHNLLLDSLLDVGLVGSVMKFGIIAYLSRWCNRKYLLYYLVFVFFWYDSVQYTHLLFVMMI